jgi:Uma2 family endonuclease
VQEYWIVYWQQQSVEIYRRVDDLRLVATLTGGDALTTPLLPGFECPISTLRAPSS